MNNRIKNDCNLGRTKLLFFGFGTPDWGFGVIVGCLGPTCGTRGVILRDFGSISGAKGIPCRLYFSMIFEYGAPKSGKGAYFGFFWGHRIGCFIDFCIVLGIEYHLKSMVSQKRKPIITGMTGFKKSRGKIGFVSMLCNDKIFFKNA